MRRGRLVVLEGVDGSGKSTQLSELEKRLSASGRDFRVLTFPRYSSPSSALIRMYLGGEFGELPEDVGPYAASTFFAVDRFASYVTDWREYFENGGLVICDRYTTSNAIHQGAKLPPDKREDFFKWLSEFEHVRMGIPAPDLVFLLDVPEASILERLKSRGPDVDIHEKDARYLALCRAAARQAALCFGWRTVNCEPDAVRRTVGDIAEEIYGELILQLG